MVTWQAGMGTAQHQALFWPNAKWGGRPALRRLVIRTDQTHTDHWGSICVTAWAGGAGGVGWGGSFKPFLTV